jgi:hypothetical protein
MIKLNYCQTIYPQKLIINNDTVVIINVEQTKYINKTYEINRSLYKKYILLQNTIDSLSLYSKEKDSLYQDKVKVSKSLEGYIETVEKQLERSNTKLSKTKKNRKWWLFGGLILGLMGGKLIWR